MRICNIVLSVFIVSALLVFTTGCDESSEDVPTSFNNIENYMEEGWDYYQNGQYENAISSFNNVLQRQADYLNAYVGIGWAHYKLGNLDETASNFAFVVSLAKIQDKQDALAEAYAGLSLTGVQRKIMAEAENDMVTMVDVTNNEIAQYGKLLTEIEPDYQHAYDPEEINGSNIQMEMAKAYYSIKYFYDAIWTVDQMQSGALSDLLTEISYIDSSRVFFTANITDEDQIFLDDTREDGGEIVDDLTNLITLDNVESMDGEEAPQQVHIVEGTRVYFPNTAVDVFSETITAKDTVMAGDTLNVLIPSKDRVYEVIEIVDEDMAPVNGNPVMNANGKIAHIQVPQAGTYEVEYRFNRQLRITYKSSSSFMQYMDIIANKLYEIQ